MTVPVWPSRLPKPMRAAYTAQYDDPRLARSGQAGPPGYRLKSSAVARQVALTLAVTRDEKAVFDNFHRDMTGFGTLPFWMPDPTTDGWPMLTDTGAPVLTETGAPVLMSAQWLCLFGSQMPRETIQGAFFQIAFAVAVMP